MSTKRKSLYVFIIILALGGLFFRPQIEDFFLSSKNKLADFKKNALDEALQNIETRVSAPPPLRTEKESPNPILTQAGTIRWTNINRQNNSLPALQENSKLDNSALQKAKDMLEKQYFDHISPSGKGPQDLAAGADYSYISIGENLAMGNFANDKELLDAWMASPGHRENILNKGFTEIGVAVMAGKFEGKNTWVAVQEFGAPLSNCPAIDASLKKTIESNSAKISSLAVTLESKRSELSKLRSSDPSLPQKIDEYNAMVKEYNGLASKTKNLIKTYNSQVSGFNSCVKSFTR